MRICSKCKHSIRRCERFHRVKSRFLGFLWTVERTEHYSCLHPATGPSPKRLRGEVPLPFPGPLETEIVYVNSQTGQISHPSPRQELADLN
jgi:hypothetical protein